MRTHTRKMGEIAPGVLPQRAKTCFFVIKAMQPFSHLYCAFETTDMNWFSHAYTVKKFRISAQGVFQVPKQPKIQYSRVGQGVCHRAAAQTAQLWAMKIISWARRHPKDMPFVREFWCGTYSLGAISPRKSPNFANFTS